MDLVRVFQGYDVNGKNSYRRLKPHLLIFLKTSFVKIWEILPLSKILISVSP